jgi:hypothetical protein
MIATEEETMAINLIDAARDNDPFSLTGEGQQALLRLLASQKVSDTRAQEEAAIDAEDFWTQAEEACAVDPIG